MKLKSLLKKLNRRNQKHLYLDYASKATGLTKEECIKEKLAIIRDFSFLKKYSTTVKPIAYYCGLVDSEIGGDYSHIRIQFGKWYEYVDIYHHRGFLFDDGITRTPQSWGINNMATEDDYAEFDTLDELRVYIERNYEKYCLILCD